MFSFIFCSHPSLELRINDNFSCLSIWSKLFKQRHILVYLTLDLRHTLVHIVSKSKGNVFHSLSQILKQRFHAAILTSCRLPLQLLQQKNPHLLDDIFTLRHLQLTIPTSVGPRLQTRSVTSVVSPLGSNTARFFRADAKLSARALYPVSYQ